MNKKAVVFSSPELEEQVDDLSDVEIDENTETGPVVNIPIPSDPEWSNYVLTYFKDDEKFNGNPTVDGLRRVAELLVGEIVSAKTTVIQCPTPDNDKRATVVCSVGFLCPNRDENNLENVFKEFQGAADAYPGNSDMPFSKYPVSMAESRAEGRALKRALKLKHIVIAEELSEAALKEDIILEEVNKLITNVQVNFIDILCRNDGRGLNISVQKLVQTNYPSVYNIWNLKHSDSLILQQKLSEFQQNKGFIPEEILGYNPNWKIEFGTPTT